MCLLIICVNANPSINIYLSILYNLCLFYGVIPDNCLALVNIPIVKDKNKDLQDVFNYRPTAVVSTISKLFERFILNQINPFLQTALISRGGVLEDILGLEQARSQDLEKGGAFLKE